MKFWLATFSADLRGGPAFSPSAPLAVPRSGGWAVEVLEDGQDYAVLFSTVDHVEAPAKLVCRIGFANRPELCNIWRGRGFPLIDSTFSREGGVLKVNSAFSRAQARDSGGPLPAMTFDELFATITGLEAVESAGTPGPAAAYEQKLQVPCSIFPATHVATKPVTWSVERSDVSGAGKLTVTTAASRFPDLAPFSSKPLVSSKTWFGAAQLPTWSADPARIKLRRAGRTALYRSPVFRFENVEVLGFRLDLPRNDSEIDAGLAALAAPLNFHLDPEQAGLSRSTARAMSDFRYRPATRTLMLEMLRYGKMKLSDPTPPIRRDDSQAQHEMLIRMLVGRVDDDTAQARNAAEFVPAIFVDNPWSKALGRDALGFDKRLVSFCILDDGRPCPLRPDGRRSATSKKAEPLGDVAEIHLSTGPGVAPDDKTLLLKIDCPYDRIDDWNAFDDIDLDVAWRSFPVSPLRWQREDFDEREFRRSFARSVTTKILRGFSSIQVSPVGEPELRQQMGGEMTWITGQFATDNGARIAWPTGIVGLTLHANEAAPDAWKALCRMLGIGNGKTDTISLPSGSWYRMRCSMALTVDNGLD